MSSWENANAIPPEERLRVFALVFAGGTVLPDGEVRVPEEPELSDGEETARRDLIDELISLREQAIRPDGPTARQTGALGGRFWYFPDGAPVRIITTRIWPGVLDAVPYADPHHPNHIQSLWDADRDATIELFGHIRAENPTSDVRALTVAQATPEDLNAGHVVILGQADSLFVADCDPAGESRSVLEYLSPRLELPLGTRVPPDGDREFDGEFVVTLNAKDEPTWFRPGEQPAKFEHYRPRFLRDAARPGRPRRVGERYPVIEYDVALLARRPNQFNLAASVTICAGVFSRGTYGAVRALTDTHLRGRNERFLSDHFGGLDDFWFLFYVPVFPSVGGLQTMTPDLGRPFHRLRDSAGGR